MNDWPKLSGETDAQYVYRVCRSKDEIGTWTDVANVINSSIQRLAGIRASALTARHGKHTRICSR